MAGKALNFDTGVVEYTINGAAKVSFNPTDSNFAIRFYEALLDLEGKQDSISAEAHGIEDPKEMFDFMAERDSEMRKTVDGLFGEGFADAVFGGSNCYAFAGGLPLWMNLMFAVADEIGEAMGREQAKTDPRLKAYDRKYSELVGKYKPKAPGRQSHK